MIANYGDKCGCPICGAVVESIEELVAGEWIGKTVQHRCNPKTLAHIDAALCTEEVSPRRPSLHRRLDDGFRMMDGESL